MDPSHVFHTPWVYVRDWPRFLAGITARLEKMKSIGSIKDLELDHGPSRAWDDYARRLLSKEAELPATVSGAKWHPTGTLLEYRWMIEEFSVSIHAQKLGTRISVSPKRIEKIQSQLATESDA
jgi:ATP-dependent helicase HrpA